MDRIAEVTEFNGQALTDGGSTGTLKMNVQVGIHNSTNDRIAIDLGDLRATTLGVSHDAGTVMSLSTSASAQAAISTL